MYSAADYSKAYRPAPRAWFVISPSGGHPSQVFEEPGDQFVGRIESGFLGYT